MAAPSTSGHIELNSSNHHEKLINGLWSKFLDKRGVDFNFLWGGRSVRAHRLLLDVFLSPSKLIQQQHVDCSVLDSLLEFLYRGRVTVARDQLNSLLAVARESDFSLLVDILEAAIVFDQDQLSDVQPTINNGQQAGDQDSPPPISISTVVTPQIVVPEQRNLGPIARPQRKLLPKIAKPPLAIPTSHVSDVGVADAATNDATNDANDDNDPANWLFVTMEQSDDGVSEPGYNDDDNDQFDYDTLVPKIELLIGDGQQASTSTRPDHAGTEGAVAPDLFSCALCDTAFNVALELKGHLRAQHPGNACKIPYKCTECGSTFQFPSQIEVHARKHLKHTRKYVEKQQRKLRLQANASRPYECDVCQKTFRAFSHLSHHKRCHVVNAQYTCQVCNKDYQYPVSLMRHMRVQHNMDTGERHPYECDDCEDTFSSRIQLVRHTWTAHKK